MKVRGGDVLLAVSCATSTFCVTSDHVGNVFTYDGSHWSDPDDVDDGIALTSASCASAAFCVVVAGSGGGDAVTWKGSGWSAPTTIDAGATGMESVSCPTAHFCAATDNEGKVVLFHGSSWSAPDPVGSGDTAISCASANFCALVDHVGNAYTYDGSGWTSFPGIDTSRSLESVSCPTPTFCAAVDNEGGAFTFDGTDWSSLDPIDSSHSLNSVSCSSSTSCVAVDDAGHVLAYNGSSWSTSFTGAPPTNLASVSCANTNFCQAVDNLGNSFSYDDAPDPALYVSGVSPSSGPINGGTLVYVTGSGFTGVTGVHFGGTLNNSPTVVSDTALEVTAPAEPAGTLDITITTPAGTSAVNPADQFTWTAHQNPTVVSCSPSCTDSVTTPLNETTVSVTGSSGSMSSASMSLVVNTDTLACSGVYDYPTAVATFSTTGFAAGTNVTVTETVGNEPSTKGVKVCFEKSGDTSGSFLKKCKSHHPIAPCLSSLAENGSGTGVVATFLVPANDPRFWTGGAPVVLKSFSPATGATGSKLTIKGKNLTGVVAVLVGGAKATIRSVSKSKLVVTVPAQASSGAVTLTAASGSVTSAQNFRVLDSG